MNSINITSQNNAKFFYTPNIFDYFELMKPRVMSLVIFTTIAGMYLAPIHIHPVLGLFSIIAIALGAGSAGASLVTGSTSASEINLVGGTNSSYHMNTSQDCLSGVIWIHNPYNSVRTSIHGELAWENASDVDAHINNIAAHPNTGASYDRWKLFPNTGTFQTTTIIQTFGVVNA